MSQQAAEVTAEAVMDPPPAAAGDSAPAPAPAPVPVPDDLPPLMEPTYEAAAPAAAPCAPTRRQLSPPARPSLTPHPCHRSIEKLTEPLGTPDTESEPETWGSWLGSNVRKVSTAAGGAAAGAAGAVGTAAGGAVDAVTTELSTLTLT